MRDHVNERNNAFDDDRYVSKLEGELEDLHDNLQYLERQLDKMEEDKFKLKEDCENLTQILKNVLTGLANEDERSELTSLVISLKLEGADQSTLISQLQSFYNLKP
jgi:predicted  nucleic acid-binding Zn-ribbon protein